MATKTCLTSMYLLANCAHVGMASTSPGPSPLVLLQLHAEFMQDEGPPLPSVSAKSTLSLAAASTRAHQASLRLGVCASALAHVEGTHAYDACHSMYRKDLRLFNTVRRDPSPTDFSCARCLESDCCHWTAEYSCPGQEPVGRSGVATDDGKFGFHCCCQMELWNQTHNDTIPLESSVLARLDVEQKPQQVVWVAGYPRSSTSTFLSMVSAANGHEGPQMAPSSTFSLFEPCHGEDVVDDELNATGCTGLLMSIADCEFSHVRHLWGWPDAHSTNNKSKYSSELASSLCKQSDVVAFKTVDFEHDISKFVDILEAHKNLKVLDVVRDPRGIWGSYKSTEPFSTLIKEGNFYTLLEICESYASNLELNHPQVHHIIFEDMISDPKATMQKAYDFLGLAFEEPQMSWIERTYDATECPPPPPGVPEEFTDCHKDSAKNLEKWRSVLDQSEIEAFNNSPACQKVQKAYGFPAS